MSGFQYMCTYCGERAGDASGQMLGESCLSCSVGRLRLSPEWLGLKEKTSAPPGSGENKGGGGPLDPTGPFSESGEDETLPTEISQDNKQGLYVVGVGDGAAPELESMDIGPLHEVRAEEDLTDGLSSDELPIAAYVTVQRKTNVSRKMIRAWKRMGHCPVTACCGNCRQTCVLAKSTLQVIDEAWGRGERYEAICGECAEEKGVREEEGGIVAVQAEELRKVQKGMLSQGAKGRVN